MIQEPQCSQFLVSTLNAMEAIGPAMNGVDSAQALMRMF